MHSNSTGALLAAYSERNMHQSNSFPPWLRSYLLFLSFYICLPLVHKTESISTFENLTDAVSLILSCIQIFFLFHERLLLRNVFSTVSYCGTLGAHFLGLTKDKGSASFLVETYKNASQSCFQQLEFRTGLDCNTFFSAQWHNHN